MPYPLLMFAPHDCNPYMYIYIYIYIYINNIYIYIYIYTIMRVGGQVFHTAPAGHTGLRAAAGLHPVPGSSSSSSSSSNKFVILIIFLIFMLVDSFIIIVCASTYKDVCHWNCNDVLMTC
jgi:hypothetical protein